MPDVADELTPRQASVALVVVQVEVSQADPVVTAQICVDGLAVLRQEVAEPLDSPRFTPQCSP